MNLRKAIIPASITAFVMALAFSVQIQALQDEADEPLMEGSEKPEFSELDTNSDGVLNLDEAQDTWLEQIFASVDLNQDGFVDQDEYYSAA